MYIKKLLILAFATANIVKSFIEKLIYFLIFMLWMPGFFEKLGMNGVASPIIGMMNKILNYLPNILGTVLLLIVGLFIGKTVKELLIPIFQKDYQLIH